MVLVPHLHLVLNNRHSIGNIGSGDQLENRLSLVLIDPTLDVTFAVKSHHIYPNESHNGLVGLLRFKAIIQYILHYDEVFGELIIFICEIICQEKMFM